MRDFLLLLFSVPLLSFFLVQYQSFAALGSMAPPHESGLFCRGAGRGEIGILGIRDISSRLRFSFTLWICFFFVRNMLESCVGRLRHCRRDFLLKNS